MSKKDKLKKLGFKKYSVTISKTISVLASDEYEAEEQARADFDCTDIRKRGQYEKTRNNRSNQ